MSREYIRESIRPLMNLYVDNLNIIYENKEYMKTWITPLEALINFIEGDKNDK